MNAPESMTRQPVHTVYGGAHLFQAGTAGKLGELARASLRSYAPDAASFGEVFQLEPELAGLVFPRVEEKLAREPVEDFRIDFEDGFGPRPDAEEDEAASTSARQLALGLEQGGLPPFIGIRVKSLSEEALERRALRTADIFLSTLLGETKGKLPPWFAVTLPKITHRAQVERLADALEVSEKTHGLPAGSLKIELMVETPQSFFDEEGRLALPALARAGKGRCVAAHFGAYDYTASLGVAAGSQELGHPACEFARQLMQVGLAPLGIWLSDGATNVMPVGPHRKPGGAAHEAENRAAVHAAWRLSFGDIQRALSQGFYQGWDLHPAQLPARYAALYVFFLKGLAPATARLKNFVERAAKASLAGGVFDDAATGQGLLNYFLRALACGAITEREVSATGLGPAEIASRSFARIVEE